MGFSEAIKSGFSNYVTFSGRARRSEYWYFMLFFMIGYIIASVLEAVLGIPGIFTLVFSLAVVLPTISVFVRRMHDIDRTGWWYWLSMVPVIGTIVLIVFACTRGTDGANRFGPDPISGSPEHVF